MPRTPAPPGQLLGLLLLGALLRLVDAGAPPEFDVRAWHFLGPFVVMVGRPRSMFMLLLAGLLVARASEPGNATTCVASILPCADRPHGCARPPGVFLFKIRGAGGKMLVEGVINHVFPRERITVAEGWSTAHGPTMAKLVAARDKGALRVTVLRHPINRALSRYWFEGRWQLFAKERSDTAAMPLHLWLMRDDCGPKGGRMGGRLWNCVANYFTKSFSGWSGLAQCDGARDLVCQSGVGRQQLAQAQRTLEQNFDVVLISEWLQAPPQIALLAKLLCFEHDVARGLPHKPFLDGRHGNQTREVPTFKPKRPAGGHSNLCPPGWTPDAADMAQLRSDNALDIELYEWAAARTRAQLASHWSASTPLTFPMLPVAAEWR